MTHLKRQNAPKSWPIPRKGTTFVVRPNFGFSKGIPLLIILRDMLKIAENKKEVKKAIYMKNIIINGRTARDEKEGIFLFDTLNIIPTKKHYRIILSQKGKFDLEEIKEHESDYKISKIIGKKILKGKEVQLNLSDGRNFLSDIKCKVNDSILINLKNKKIEKIDLEKKIASINKGNENINVLIKQFMVIE